MTIAISVIVSAFNALTLSPALGGMLLRPRKRTHGPLARFFDWFNRTFERGKDFYLRTSGALIRRTVLAVVALAGFVVAGFFFAKAVPTSFLPDEDQGYMFVQMQVPESSSFQSTSEDVLKATPGVKYCTTAVGFSLLSLTRSNYNAFFYVTLEPWENRKTIEAQYQLIQC